MKCLMQAATWRSSTRLESSPWIPCIYGVDQIHGASYTQGATLFPQGINMGASFNRGLMRRCSEISAYETRACAIPWTFAPVMDLGRDPRWPRMWESYGERALLDAIDKPDPHLAGLSHTEGNIQDRPNL